MSKHPKILVFLLVLSFAVVFTGIAQQQAEEKVVCPVSGKEITKSEAKGSYEYEGKTYYFCCESCKEKFMKDPEKYLQKKEEMKEVYTCPMHPEVKSDTPGECPKCGMKLEKKMMSAAHMHGMMKEKEKMMHMQKEGKSCCAMMGMMGQEDVEMSFENLENGIAVKITSQNAETVKKLQEHAAKMKEMCAKKKEAKKEEAKK